MSVVDEQGNTLTVREVVNEQANDAGLWFNARTAPEGYLQQELRRLHESVEDGPNTQWQPIETAPKDGTGVLACRELPTEYPIHVVVKWERDAWEMALNYECKPYALTHWMPLPEPPKGE